MKNSSIDTHMGSIAINQDVIAQYAGSVAVECFGIVGMTVANVRDGLVRILKVDSLSKGINVSFSANHKDPGLPRDRCLWRQHRCGCRQSDRQRKV